METVGVPASTPARLRAAASARQPVFEVLVDPARHDTQRGGEQRIVLFREVHEGIGGDAPYPLRPV